MSPDQWNKLVSLFHAACEKTGKERVALLDSACSGDPALRLALEQMLEDDKTSGSFFDRPPVEKLAALASSQTTPAEVGAKFGRYELLRPIGCGGMGEVWAAHDMELDRPVALKFLFPALGAVAERLTREAKAASALNHPDIVTVYEVVWHEDTPIIAMELVDGQSLRALTGVPQPPERVIELGLQAARALAAAHAHGIVHCDIKPENILLRNDGYVKVLDFGLARQTQREPETWRIGGTLRYMSPEQARGESPAPASDIFSLGLVLYELATGRHAFERDTAAEVVQAILNDQAVAPSSEEQRLDSLILRMLAHEPAARPSAQEVARTLHEMQGSAAAGNSRFPHAKWLAASVCLLTACILLAWWWTRRPASGNQPKFSQVTTLLPENRATAAAISPDGKLAAYANIYGIFIRSLRNGDTKPLRGPGDFTVDRLAWFSDQKHLVAGGFSNQTYVPSIWSISATGAPPRLLRTHAREAAPSPDGKHIAFISQDWSEIWVMGTNGLEPRRLVDTAGDELPILFWLSKGRLGFQVSYIPSAHLRSYRSVVLTTGRTVTLAQNLSMSSASMLPDGWLVYLRWDNGNNISSRQLWEVRTDPLTGTLLGKPRRVATLSGEPGTLLDLSVAANGKEAMVLKRSDQNSIFVGNVDRSPPRITNIHRLTLNERSNYPHAWTADSREVIFESDRNGNFDLFKQDIDRPTPETIVATPLTEILPQLSPDGRFVLYAAGPRPGNQQTWYYKLGTYKLMRVPVNGGIPAVVPIGGMLDEFRCALERGKRCVLRTTVGRNYFVYYDLNPISGKGRELARTKWMPTVLGDWDISPDGKYIALPNHSSRDARIRIVALEPGPNQPREREVVLPGLTNLRGLVWAASGKAWFVSIDTTVGHRLLYVYLDGRYRSLGDIQGWAVPSPDGRHVAFMNPIVATNAWIIDRR